MSQRKISAPAAVYTRFRRLGCTQTSPTLARWPSRVWSSSPEIGWYTRTVLPTGTSTALPSGRNAGRRLWILPPMNAVMYLHG